MAVLEILLKCGEDAAAPRQSTVPQQHWIHVGVCGVCSNLSLHLMAAGPANEVKGLSTMPRVQVSASALQPAGATALLQVQ